MKKKLLILLFIAALLVFGVFYYKYTQYYYGDKCYQEFVIETEQDAYTIDYTAASTIPVHLENPSRNSVDTSNGYYLSYHILDENGNEIVHDGVQTIIDVGPFSTQDVEMTFEVPAPGTYTMVVDVLKEGVLWFESGGGTVKNITITVKP